MARAVAVAGLVLARADAGLLLLWPTARGLAWAGPACAGVRMGRAGMGLGLAQAGGVGLGGLDGTDWPARAARARRASPTQTTASNQISPRAPPRAQPGPSFLAPPAPVRPNPREGYTSSRSPARIHPSFATRPMSVQPISVQRKLADGMDSNRRHNITTKGKTLNK